jgi:hypothetical protein
MMKELSYYLCEHSGYEGLRKIQSWQEFCQFAVESYDKRHGR